eukprot:TRINITY_DN22882_c0_g1_i1.p1 TRINITY_DN22882_c0_g1~~TRINITY_DN22882_c0_g1_i1.p1  ORF type:complete len:178 (+),score=27.72 TRINITY_DN22882_c0_g1_i1:92-625(+)
MVRGEDGRGRTSVQFSAGLLNQLTGRGKKASTRQEPEESKQPQNPPLAPLPLIPPMSPSGLTFNFPGAMAGSSRLSKEESQRDQRTKELTESMRHALENTTSLANKLMASEEEEVERVKSLAQELHDKEFRAPSRPTRCQSEKDECVRCYQTNSQDVLRCAQVVSDFVSCSRRAQQA